jgi:hypothetical protein
MTPPTLEAERTSCTKCSREPKWEAPVGPAPPLAQNSEARLFYIVTNVAGAVMFLLAAFAIFLLIQTLLWR